MFHLPDIRDDDDNSYKSAKEDGSLTSYGSIKTHKSQPSLGSVIIQDILLPFLYSFSTKEMLSQDRSIRDRSLGKVKLERVK